MADACSRAHSMVLAMVCEQPKPKKCHRRSNSADMAVMSTPQTLDSPSDGEYHHQRTRRYSTPGLEHGHTGAQSNGNNLNTVGLSCSVVFIITFGFSYSYY